MTSNPVQPGPRPTVRGLDLDPETRCRHYRTSVDVIAIRAFCCGDYYACNQCHDALAGHDLLPWPSGTSESRAVMCGGCGSELTIRDYLSSTDRCTHCGAAFNPRCSLHHHLYFST